ncbi:hypothetical protein BX666DRAFT_1905291 [Dichotomocladium elegans]|nr:hypothetical protein BX666DRAFT_1905291 [Dichotomocladium elegans]
MADDFDDELYNVYNTAQEDAYSNTDIYAEDYKDESDALDKQNTSSNESKEVASAGAVAAGSFDERGDDRHDHNTSTGYDRSKDNTAPHDPAHDSDQHSPNFSSGGAGGNPYQQQQQQMFMNFPQQQQAMMGGWNQFPPNPYQYAMYQRAMQLAMNPYQLQQMMQRQMRQQQPHYHSNSSQQSSQPASGSPGNNEDADLRQPPSVASAANQDEGKMFIGGLNWDTTDETLKQYFTQFGEVLDCVVMRDPATGRSRGFGFLTMADPAAIDTIVSQDHYLDGKRIDPKRAIPREEQDKTEKIFVGGVSPDVNEDEFREFFTKFGNVLDATLMTDRDTGRPRGFGFITFEDSSGVDEALRQPGLAIKNKTIEVKKAMPKSKQMRQGMMGSNFGGSAGGSGGRVGYMPNSRYTGAAYGGGGRGGSTGGYGGMGAGGAGGMYGGGMYGGYGNYNMAAAAAAAYYGRGAGYGMGGGGGGSGGMYGGNNVRGGGSNQYDDDYHDHNNDDYDDDGGRSTRNDDRRRDHGSSSGRGSSSGGGAIHASQSTKNQHHYRPY